MSFNGAIFHEKSYVGMFLFHSNDSEIVSSLHLNEMDRNDVKARVSSLFQGPFKMRVLRDPYDNENNAIFE